VQVALREGQLDTVRGEKLEGSEIKVGLEDLRGVGVVGCPNAQVEVETVIAIVGKHHIGRRGFEYRAMFPGDLKQESADLLDIGVVADTDWQMHAYLRVIGREVGDGIINEVGVGHDDDDVVIRANPGGAGSDADDVAEGFLDLDAVADADGLLNEQNEPRDEVGHNILKAKTDADADSAADDNERLEIEPERLQADEHAEQEKCVSDESPEGELLRFGNADVTEQASEQDGLQEARQNDQQHQKKDDLERKKYADVKSADVQQAGGENVLCAVGEVIEHVFWELLCAHRTDRFGTILKSCRSSTLAVDAVEGKPSKQYDLGVKTWAWTT
jgi:hypothetical protein